LLLPVCIAAAALALAVGPRRVLAGVARVLRGRYTVAGRLRQYGPAARKRLAPHFRRAGVAYPPERVVLVGLKKERRLEVWAGPHGERLRYVRSYPILGASGVAGPKLRRGDRQVPEGLYGIDFLNPNSRYHVSMRIAYPNAFDRQMARADERKNLGGDIMIHGGTGSVGCLAMGDPASEDLFVLVADAGRKSARVLISPVDFRTGARPKLREGTPGWVPSLHRELRRRLAYLKR
jgi:hypothetical protein